MADKDLPEITQVTVHCAVCGCRDRLKHEAGRAARDNYRCSNCRSMQRQRDAAQIIVDEFGEGTALDLNGLMGLDHFRELSIYEIGIRGPIADRLSSHPGYVNSYFWEDAAPGEFVNGVQCQDVRQLTYDDESFDLIVSLELFEHVFETERALREIRRVLKPGGIHVFSVPVIYPLPETSRVRAELDGDRVVHLVEPRYHVAGDMSKSLVVTDWGRDFVQMHRRCGLRLSFIRRSAPVAAMIPNATLLARRL